MRSTALLLLAACAAFSLSVFAQEPPGRVGRISYLEGPASVYQDPDTGWQDALLNIPVTSENSVWTDRGARAEVQVGGSALRLASRTQLDISRLDDSGLDATVAEGRASLRVRYKQPSDHYDLSTPSASFEITRDGLYRLEYNADYDESRFSVLAGDARMHSDGGDITIGPGRMIVVSGGDSPSYDIFAAARPDAFDRWVQTRDARFHPPRYVSPYMTGYQDLEAYGKWSNDPDYGEVWYPTRVSSDWAPYREGRWSYVEPWGWTWVDDAPWGYAPFHYGRWVNVNNRWGWIPGQHVDRPTWAPALVAFLGLSSASSSPSVGWYPLAPSEQYHPWYRADSRYTDRINQVFVRNQASQNARGHGEQAVQVNRDRGATVVNRNALIQRSPVQQARVQVNPQAIRQGSVVAPAQVVQALPQRTEVVRHRQETQTKAPQPPAPPPAVAARQQQQQQAAPGKAPPATAAAPGAALANAIVRPAFRREQAPKPAPAPTPAARATQQTGKAPPPAPANPIARTPPVLPGAPGKAPESKGPPAESKAPAAPSSNAPAANNPPSRLPIAPPASGETKAQQDSQRQQETARRLEELRQQRQQQQTQQQQQQQQQIQQRQQQEAQQRQQQEAQKQQQQEALKQQQQQQQQQREQQQRQQQDAQKQQQQEALKQQQQQREQQQRQQQDAQKQQQQEALKQQQQQQQQQHEQQQRQQQEAQKQQQQEALKQQQQQQQQREQQQRQQQEAQKQQPQEALKQQQQQQQQRLQQQQQERLQQLQRAPQTPAEKAKEKEKEKEKDDKQPR